jgi:hypothetical protein
MKIEERLADLLKDDPTIMFRVGDKTVLAVIGTTAHKFSVNFSQARDYKDTFQYRTMIALGYTSLNGITYSYKDKYHDIWVRFQKGKIDLIKDNLGYVQFVSYKRVPVGSEAGQQGSSVYDPLGILKQWRNEK